MKDTGVIRKIDELGRIVIPKEIRRSLGIRDGENLEIFVSDKGICLQKHSRLVNYQELADQLCNFSYEVMGYKVVVCDREEIFAAFKNEYKHISLNSRFEKLMDNRESYESVTRETFFGGIGTKLLLYRSFNYLNGCSWFGGYVRRNDLF